MRDTISGRIDVQKLRREMSALDQPTSRFIVKPWECKEHTFIERDRCRYCGAPEPRS